MKLLYRRMQCDPLDATSVAHQTEGLSAMVYYQINPMITKKQDKVQFAKAEGRKSYNKDGKDCSVNFI